MSDEIYGPPQDNPFERLTDEQRARLDKALAIADGIRFYHIAGGMGASANWKSHAEDLANDGGLDPEHALALARYRMWKQGKPVFVGEKFAPRTDAERDARSAEFRGADYDKKTQMMHEDAINDYRTHELYFDKLVQNAPETNHDEIVDETKPAKKVADVE